MKPIKFSAWAITDKDGEVLWTDDKRMSNRQPLTFIRPPSVVVLRAYEGHHVAPVLVTITPAKRAAKRGKR